MRLIGKDVALFEVGAGVSYLTTLKEASFDVTYDEQENSAIKDTFHFVELTKQDWTCEFTLQAVDTAYPAVLTAMQAGTELALSCIASNGGSFDVAITGTGILQSFGLELADSAQGYRFRLRPRGLLSMVAA